LCCALFTTIRNDAKYEAVKAGLETAVEIEIRLLCLCGNSQLVANQIPKEFQTQGERITSCLKKVKTLLNKLDGYIIKHIPQEENQEANHLAKQANVGGESI